MNKLAGLIACTLLLAGCQQQASSATRMAPQSSASAAPAASASLLDQPGELIPPRSAAQMLADQLDAELAGSWRSAAHKARDVYRHPKQTLTFFGIEPDMTVIEIMPGGGWYAELLAPLLNDSGQYVAAVPKSNKPNSEANAADTAVGKLIKAYPAQFGHARVVRFDPHAPVFGEAGSADAVLTFRNVHNWVMGDYAPQMFAAFFKVLKPGGVLGVVDHRATPGVKLDAALKKTGYLPQAYVIRLATDAGFKLLAKSDINANAKDDHDHPKGVWTLPPTLALHDQDKAKYLAIGESDRMTLRFVKPAATEAKPDEIKRAGMETPMSAGSVPQ